MKFVIHDSVFDDDMTSVWIAARINGDPKKLFNAYIDENGEVYFDDFQEWRIDNDLKTMGITPGSKRAVKLVNAWEKAAREYGLALLRKAKGE